MTIHFRNADEDFLLTQERLGTELEVAKGSYLYKWLNLMHQAAREAAVAEWKAADPTDIGKVARLQALVIAYDGMNDWLDQQIAQGLEARREIEAREHQATD